MANDALCMAMFSTDTQHLVDDNISEKIPETIHCRCLGTGRSGRLDCQPFIVIHHSHKTLILVENTEILYIVVCYDLCNVAGLYPLVLHFASLTENSAKSLCTICRAQFGNYREHVTCQSKPESCNSWDWFVPIPLTVFCIRVI